MKNDKVININDKLEIAIKSIEDVISEIIIVDNFYTYEEQNIERDIFANYIKFSNKTCDKVMDVNYKLKELKVKCSEFYDYLLREQYNRARKSK